jgi:signal transduction histidine kinase
MATPTNAAPAEALVRFARRVSHDVNNFSTVVSTYSELLLADLPPDAPAHADVKEIHTAAEQMVQYLYRVTRFARAGSLRPTPIAIQPGIDAAITAFQGKTPTRDVQIEASINATINADPTWWSDMLGELLTNAHEAAPEGTSITVRSVVTDGVVLVQVRDQGTGPSPEILKALGEPFVTTKQGVRGAGMGLALVSAFALAVKGTFALERDGTHTVAELAIPAS